MNKCNVYRGHNGLGVIYSVLLFPKSVQLTEPPLIQQMIEES